MGKIMKNGICYTGSSVGDINSIVETAVNDYLKDSFKVVILDNTPKITVLEHDKKTCKIPYNNKIPEGYTVLGIEGVDFNYGGSEAFGISEIKASATDTSASITVYNPLATSINFSIYLRLFCVKSELVSD